MQDIKNEINSQHKQSLQLLPMHQQSLQLCHGKSIYLEFQA
jgi:hypothetical protein